MFCRVWFTIRNTATHSGPLKFFSKTFKPTGKQVLGAPGKQRSAFQNPVHRQEKKKKRQCIFHSPAECLSYTFDSEGRCTSFTGGYIMDRR